MTAPSVGDILIAAKAFDWPSVTAAGVSVGPGEPAWRQAVEAMTYDGRMRFWTAWGEINRGGVRHRALSPALNATRSQADDSPDPQPSPGEFATFVRAAAAAQRHGISLHPDVIQVVWFDRSVDGNEAPGSFDSRDFVIYLQRGLSEMELFRTVVHELQHAADRLSLGQEYYAMGRAEQERRADAAEYQVCWAEGFAVFL
jgi:hypothetical protein